jgi:hypothetical protein
LGEEPYPAAREHDGVDAGAALNQQTHRGHGLIGDALPGRQIR